MPDLSLGRVPAILGAAGAGARLGEHLTGLADIRRAAVMLDPNLDASAILAGFDGLEALPVVLPPGEPKEAFVAETAARLGKSGAEAVVCIGGGSTMDAGKLVANLIGDDAPIERYRLAATPLPKARLPLVCAPTTAGTGAEATSVSVLSAPDGAKYWYWAASLKPDLIVHDPVLTVSLPASVTAATGLDALVHAMEAATNLNASNANNMYALRAVELVAAWLPLAVSEPANLAARAAMLEAATLAGIAIDNAGTAIAHNIGHALGSVGRVPHGRAVAIGMCATLAWNVAHAPAVYAPVARALGCGEAEALPAAFVRLVRDVGLDLSVPDVAVQSLVSSMAAPENAAMLKSNRRPVASDDLDLHARAALALGAETIA